jgi:hypothetical protein
MGQMRRFVIPAIVVVLILAAAGYLDLRHAGVFSPSAHAQLKSLAKSSQSSEPAWYAGDTLGTLQATGAAGGDARRIAAIGYGDCHRVGQRWDPFATSTCGFPLLVQTWRLDQGTQVNSDFIPTLGDGTCARTTLRGVPAAISTDGVVLYTGSEAIGVLGPPELVGRAVQQLRRVGSDSPGGSLPAPNTQPGAALAQCRRATRPFEPLSARIERLLRTSSLPLVGAGTWFEDGRLTSAEQAASTVSLDYESCRLDASLGSCANVLSVNVQPLDKADVSADLRGARCKRFTLGGAPGVTWNNQTDAGDAAGLYLFTGGATVATARDFTLEHVGAGKLDRAVRALRPLEGTTLPKPTYDAAALVALCAKTT